MAYSTNESVEDYKHTYFEDTEADCLWDKEYMIDKSIQEAKAKVCNLEHTIRDMDMQLEIRQTEQAIASANYEERREVEWLEKNKKILKAKQTTSHVLAAYNYFIILNEESNVPRMRFNALIKLLIDDPHNFEELAMQLLY